MAPKRKIQQQTSSTVNETPSFEEGDEVFCLDVRPNGKHYYKARIVEVNQDSPSNISYRIHYLKWNTRFDEDVESTEERILATNDENKAFIEKFNLDNPLPQKTTKRQTSATKKGGRGGSVTPGPTMTNTSRGSTPSADASTPPPPPATSTTGSITKPAARSSTPVTAVDRKKKAGSKAASPAVAGVRGSGGGVARTAGGGGRSLDVGGGAPAPNVESASNYANKQEMCIKIPETLKNVLVDDWDLITQQYCLVKMPAATKVEKIVTDYKAHVTKSAKFTRQQASMYAESAEGIEDYFNAALGTQLLYKFERPQYAEFDFGERKPAQVYGFVHLLRLFVRLGSMLAQTQWSKTAATTMLKHIHDFIAFVNTNMDSYFKKEGEYEVAPPDYQKKAFT